MQRHAPDPREGHDFSRAIKTRKKIQAPQGNTYTRTKRSPNQPRRKTPPDTNSLRRTRRSLAIDAAWMPARQPAPDRLSATPSQQDSPRSARTGRTVSNPSSHHPKIRVISCSWKGTTSVVPYSTRKDSGTANPPAQPKSTPPAHFSFSNRSAALSIISQVMESFSILT